MSPDNVVELLGKSGLVVHASVLREPVGFEKNPQAYLMARKPEAS